RELAQALLAHLDLRLGGALAQHLERRLVGVARPEVAAHLFDDAVEFLLVRGVVVPVLDGRILCLMHGVMVRPRPYGCLNAPSVRVTPTFSPETVRFGHAAGRRPRETGGHSSEGTTEGDA